MLAPWNGLLALARQGEIARLRDAIAGSAALLRAHKPQPDAHEPYGRRVLHQSEQGEVMLAGWPRGARSAPHDHGSAAGFVFVIDGHFAETRYAFDGRNLRALASHRYAPWDCLCAAPGAIHDMHAHSEGTSLHFYAPAIADMRVFDLVARATFVVPGEAGAWPPRAGERVCQRIAWDGARRAP
jgi:predicted metal-dependent enzyme (double-stranded beta helix superfamily)